MTALHAKLSSWLASLSVALDRWASWHRARTLHANQLRLPLERMASGKRRMLRCPR